MSQKDSLCWCAVCDLLKISFQTRDFRSKKVVIEHGRHTPKLNFSLKAKNCIRKFNNQMYVNNEWLAGCSNKQRVYCWPCLLFAEDKNVWNVYGYNDLSNIHNAVKKHSLSESHLSAILSEKTFGKEKIENLSSDQKANHDPQHNEIVQKNREIMERYIDAVCYLTKTESSVKGDNYVEFIDVLSKYDLQLRDFLDKDRDFTALTSFVQDEIIESVSYVLLDEIKKEIQRAKFVSVMLDESPDVTDPCQLVCALRYFLDDKVIERFVGIENISQVESFCTFFTNLVQKYECENQIVAQTYDGAAITSRDLESLHLRIKQEHPTALFPQCFTHDLNSVLTRSVAKISKCKTFFMTLNGLSSFFSESTKRTDALNEELSTRNLPKVTATRWNSASSLVETVFECKEAIIMVFKKMRDSESDFDEESYNRAGGYLMSMTDFSFCFLLNIFASVFPLSGTLFNMLQGKIYDVEFSLKKVNEFCLALERMKGEFENIWVTTKNCDYVDEDERRYKKPKGNVDAKTSFSQLYDEIYDTIIHLIKVRFSHLESLRFLELLHYPLFQNFDRRFPNLALQWLKNNYDEHFDFLALRSQLKVIYMSEQFRDKSVEEILSFIRSNNLEKAYNEAAKLCELILTVPTTPVAASGERSFSTLKHLKNCTKNPPQGQGSLESLAILKIEKELLHDLQGKSEFYSQVTDHFARKSRKILLNYDRESMPQKKCYVGRMTPKAQKVRAARMSESEDRRAKRLAADRMRQAISRLKESDETRAVRLEKMRIRKQEQRLRITQQRNARNLRQAVDAVMDKTMRLHEASVHFNVAQGKISSQIKKLKTAKKTKGGRRSTATIGLNPVFETLSSTDSVYEYFPQSKPTDDDAEDQKKQERQFGDNFSEETCQMSFAESTSSSPTQMRVQQQKEILLVANHQNSIMSNLVSLWKSGKLCDAAISNGSTTIKVHKVVLSAVCPNLLSTCSADFFSHKFMQVNFPKEVSAETLNVFAEYMYKGVLNLDPDILEQLKIIANKLAMKEFEELCDRHLPKNNQQSETPAADTAAADALLNNNRLSQTQTVPIVHTTRTLSLASVDSSAVSGPVIQTGPSIENPFINIKQEISEDGLMAMVVSLLPDKSPTSSVVDPLVKIEVVGPEDGKYEHWSSSGNEHALTSTTLSSSIAPATRASVPSTASSVPSSSTAPSSSSSSTVFTIPFLKATNIKSARLKTTPCSEAPPLISELSSVSRIVKTGCWSQPNLINVDSSKMSKWPSVSISPIDGPSNTNKELVYPIELFTSRGDNLPLPKTDS